MSPESSIQATEQINQEADFREFLQVRKKLVEDYLQTCFKVPPELKASSRLWEAMEYSALNGGKRLRSILCFATYEAIAQKNNRDYNINKILPIAAGIECVHAMSLVHDDLPCMDNDDLRRGKPTCHKAFDEATALLAGDALLIRGIHLCLKADLPTEIIRKITSIILESLGARGMTAGQMVDLLNTDKENISVAELENMHKLKTGAFLKSSVLAGAYAAQASESEIRACEVYAESIGLAFQIVDDLLDLEADSATLGKTAGKDEAQNKTTYPKLLGHAESKQRASDLINHAISSLKIVGFESPYLVQIANYIISRKY
jgi:geranylgeranyl pyrophosphate synthase